MELIKGNIIEAFERGEIDYLAHQCNCLGIYGAGLAKSLASLYPDIAIHVDINSFGKYDLIRISKGRYIINLYTQKYLGPPSLPLDSLEFRLEALKKVFSEIHKFPKLGIPLIASGLAKADNRLSDLDYFMSVIEPNIREFLSNVKVYYL